MILSSWFLILQLAIVSQCTVYFEERFLDDSLTKWKVSEEAPAEGLGKFNVQTPKKVNDEKEDLGLKTTEDARFYRTSAVFENPIQNKDKTLCVQFSVKHEQDIDCGGGYVKLMGKGFEPEKLTGDSHYEIMFGPDICGFSKRIVHLIFSYKGQNHLIKAEINCPADTRTHLYTLILKPDNTFEVLVDQESKRSGHLADDWEMLPPKMIDDPDLSKPEDWVDDAEIPDVNDKKPDDWDQPATIPDTKATQPTDWDDEMDGDWTPPNVPNPEFKGEWKPKMIPNPEYKGPWEHPQIPNPEYKDDPELLAREITGVALDLWQVKSGSIFDNFIISDSPEECKEHAKYWKARFDFEESNEDKPEEKLDEAPIDEAEDETPKDEVIEDKEEPAGHEEL